MARLGPRYLCRRTLSVTLGRTSLQHAADALAWRLTTNWHRLPLYSTITGNNGDMAGHAHGLATLTPTLHCSRAPRCCADKRRCPALPRRCLAACLLLWRAFSASTGVGAPLGALPSLHVQRHDT